MINRVVINNYKEETDKPHVKGSGIHFSRRNIWKGNVYREGNYIVKDYSNNSFIPKLFGAICIYLETSAMKKLEGIKGIPSFHSKPTAFCLKMEAVPGIPLASLKKGEISQKFFNRLVSLFDQIHARGVVHVDAHMRNILVNNEMPYLVDFSTAYIKGRLPFLEPGLFKVLVLLDKERLYKVERFFFDRGVPPDMFFLYKKLKRLRSTDEKKIP